MVYDYIYYPSERTLVSNIFGTKKDLTKKEHILLMLLIKKEFVSKKEMAIALTGIYDENSFNAAKKIKSLLCIKTKIYIKAKRDCGYRLISTIELKEREVE